MKWSKWQIFTALGLVAASALLYAVHYLVFADAHHILLWSFTNLAFLPISVLFVSLIIGRLLQHRDRRAKLEKLNMVIGAFFIEAGHGLLQLLSVWDEDIDGLQHRLAGISDWQPQAFVSAARVIPREQRTIDPEAMDLAEAHEFLLARRDFLLRLLENPNLLEHEAFTALLRAVLHVAEELGYRDDLANSSAADRQHLAGDLRRAYVLLLQQWLLYLAFIKRAYPYLFSLAVRTNPFDPTASAVIGQRNEVA